MTAVGSAEVCQEWKAMFCEDDDSHRIDIIELFRFSLKIFKMWRLNFIGLEFRTNLNSSFDVIFSLYFYSNN